MVASVLSSLSTHLATVEIRYLLRPLLKILQCIFSLVTILSNEQEYYPKQAIIPNNTIFDVVIVGGGTAGCVLANRLTENPETTVLLIEAGGIPSIASKYLGLFYVLDYSNEEWNYYAENNGYASQAVKKAIKLTAGKMLGGSSGLGYMAYMRGAPSDYDKWVSLGNDGWGWNDIFKYFIKSESIDDVGIYRSNTSYMHGKDGPINVKMPEWKDRLDVYLKGFAEYGYETLFDINGGTRQGYAVAQFAVDDHYRQSTAYTHIRPIKNRPNLFLLRNTVATKIIVNEEKIATGVEIILHTEKRFIVNVGKEVVVSAGTFNSPKLLMLSGIGPRSHLEENCIEVKVDSPNVGKNLIDSPLVFVSVTGKAGYESSGRFFDLVANIDKFSNAVAIGHISLDPSQNSSDYQSNILPVSAASLVSPLFCSSVFRLADEICISAAAQGISKETLFNALAFLQPESRGWVKLNSKDPQGPPIINLNYYSNPKDLEKHADYIKDYVAVVNTKIFQSFDSRIVNLNVKQCKHLEFTSDEYWKCYIKNIAASMWNFSGTCKMGSEGVLDSRLRVKGVKHLRVIDASIIPSPVGGNIFATVVMIAEKASDMIKEDLVH